MKIAVNEEFAQVLLEQEKEKFLQLKQLYAIELKQFQSSRSQLQDQVLLKSKTIAEFQEQARLLETSNEGVSLENERLAKELHNIEVDSINLQKEEADELTRLRQKVNLLKMELKIRTDEHEKKLKVLREEASTAETEKRLTMIDRLRQFQEQKQGLLLRSSLLDEEIMRFQEVITKMKIDDHQQIDQAEEEARLEIKATFDNQIRGILSQEIDAETAIKSLESVAKQNLDRYKGKITQLSDHIGANQTALLEIIAKSHTKAKTIGAKTVQIEQLALTKQRVAFDCYNNERSNCFMRICLREHAALKREEFEKLNAIRNDTITELNNSIALKRKRLAELEKTLHDEQLEMERRKLEAAKLAEILVHSVNNEISTILRNV